jgi:hypothetical protein
MAEHEVRQGEPPFFTERGANHSIDCEYTKSYV